MPAQYGRYRVYRVPMLWVKQGYQILVMELNLNFLHDMFQKMSSEGVRYYLKDEDNNVLMCADKEYIGKKINEKGEKTVVDAELKKENWTVLAVIDKDILHRTAENCLILLICSGRFW